MDWEDDDDGVEAALSLIATTDLMYERRHSMSFKPLGTVRLQFSDTPAGSGCPRWA